MRQTTVTIMLWNCAMLDAGRKHWGITKRLSIYSKPCLMRLRSQSLPTHWFNNTEAFFWKKKATRKSVKWLMIRGFSAMLHLRHGAWCRGLLTRRVKSMRKHLEPWSIALPGVISRFFLRALSRFNRDYLPSSKGRFTINWSRRKKPVRPLRSP